MKTKSQANPLSIVFILILAAAMIAGIVLVNQNQETRRGAYFSGAKLLIQPESITANVGDDVPAQLWVNTDNNAKVSAVDVNICYGSKISLNADDVTTLITTNQEAFKSIEYAKAANNCLRLVAVAGGIDSSSLKSGMVKVADIRFKAVSTGSGTITINQSGAKVSGYNPAAGATDTSMKIGGVTNAAYTIGGGGEEPTGTEPTGTEPTGTEPTGTEPTGTEPTGTEPTGTEPTGTEPTGTEPTGTEPTGTEPTGTEPTSEPTSVQPTNEPTIPSGQSVMLKFDFTMAGVLDSAMCQTESNSPVTVTVRANNGDVKTYTNVVPVSTASLDNGLKSYHVELPLTGFTHSDGVAVFIKSPKSLQVKYGVDGQSEYYKIAGGELSGLTTDMSTTPTFNFTGYPLLAGDINHDGVVDGVDFSIVKTAAIKRTAVDDGGYMAEDLNGNCQMESQDVSLLMLSLAVKEGQLY